MENIPSRDPWTRETHLEDVDASIGHVLIHFLHTGVYQTLNDEDIEGTENTHQTLVRDEFQTAVLALKAAKKYSVPGLQELAQIELERRGKEMCLRDAVRAIREDSVAGPADEHAWLRDFVSKKVRWTFEQDPHMLSAPDFFENIESTTLTKLLAQLIVGLYSEKIASLHKGETATSKISTPECTEPPGSSLSDLSKLPSRRIAEISNAWPASVEKFGAFDDSVAAWDPHNLGQDPGNRPEAIAFAALSSCNKEEKMELEKRMKVEAAAEDRGNAEARAQEEDLAEIRQLEAEKGTTTQLQEQDVTTASSATSKDEADTLEFKSMWGSWSSAPVIPGKKKKKGKKDYTLEPPPPPMSSSPPSSPHNIQLEIDSTPVIDDVATVAANLPAAQEDPGVEVDPYGGLSMSRAKKLEAKLDEETRLEDEEDTKGQREKEEAAEIKRQEEEEEERLRLEAEEAELKRIEEEEAAAAATAEAEESKNKEDDVWGDWRGAAPTVKKKKKKKDTKVEPIHLEEEEAERIRLAQEEEAAAAVVEAETSRKKEDPIWDEWGALSAGKMKKKSKKGELIRLEEEGRLAKKVEEETERRKQEEEEAAAAAKPLILSATSGLSWGENLASNTDDWAAFGAGALSKKKKSKKAKRISVEEEEAERIRLEEEKKEAAAAAEAGVSTFDPAIETGATANDDDCKLRLEHLSRIHGWQNCKPCELYMRKIAIKLHSVGLPNVNGLSTMN